MTHIDSWRTHTYAYVTSTSHLTKTSGRRILTYSFFSAFSLSLSLAAFAPLNFFPESVSPYPKRQSTAGPYNPPFIPCAFYFTTLCANCRRTGSSTGSSACCVPPGDELLLSRASRSRVRTLCGLSSRSRGARPRKAQIAKNNIALGWRGRK